MPEGEIPVKSGTDVYRSFTWVYVVFRMLNKHTTCDLYLQAFSKKNLKNYFWLMKDKQLIFLFVKNQA